MPNFNHNSNPQQNVHSGQENSGIFINFRLSDRVIATTLGMIVTFTAGVGVGGTQNVNHNQNTVDCSVQNTSISVQELSTTTTTNAREMY